MHPGKEMTGRVLNDVQRKQFLHDGFAKLEGAFSGETAAQAREILWREVGSDPGDHKTWTRPVVRLGDFAQKPFRQAVNSDLLHSAFDEIVGVGRWVPKPGETWWGNLGTDGTFTGFSCP